MWSVAAVLDHADIDHFHHCGKICGTALFQIVVKFKTQTRQDPLGHEGFFSSQKLHNPQYNALRTAALAGSICILCFCHNWVYLPDSFHYLFIPPILPVKPLASPLSNSLRELFSH